MAITTRSSMSVKPDARVRVVMGEMKIEVIE
jgi:hypothetical protein